MTTEQARNVLMLALAAGAVLGTTAILVFLWLGLIRVSEAIELFERLSGFYSPFLGMIVGFHFAKS